MDYMFYNAQAFDGFIRLWNTTNVTSTTNMLKDTKININPVPSDYFTNQTLQQAMDSGLITREETIQREFEKIDTNLKQYILDNNLIVENFDKQYLFDNGLNSYVLNTELNKSIEYLQTNGFLFVLPDTTLYFNRSFSDYFEIDDIRNVYKYTGILGDYISSDTNYLIHFDSNQLFYLPKDKSGLQQELFSSTPQFVDNVQIEPNSIITSRVTDFSSLFYNKVNFNTDISAWDTSNVTSMKEMFHDAKKFNQPLKNWDVSNVVDMSKMFRNAKKFDRNLNDWDVSNVTSMNAMFESFNQTGTLSSFKGEIANWNTSNVRDMGHMFKGAFLFNININTKIVNSGLPNEYKAWDTSNVTSMKEMFYNNYQNETHRFNKSIIDWNTSKVKTMNRMFMSNGSNIHRFNRPLAKWDVSSVTDMYQMFNNGDIDQFLRSWDVDVNNTNVTDIFQRTVMKDLDLNTYFLGKPVEELIQEGYITFLQAYNQGLLSITLKEAVTEYQIVSIPYLIENSIIPDIIYAINNSFISYIDAYNQGLLDFKVLTKDQLDIIGLAPIELYTEYDFTKTELEDLGFVADDFEIRENTIPHLNKSFDDYFVLHTSRDTITLRPNHGLDLTKSHLIGQRRIIPYIF